MNIDVKDAARMRQAWCDDESYTPVFRGEVLEPEDGRPAVSLDNALRIAEHVGVRDCLTAPGRSILILFEDGDALYAPGFRIGTRCIHFAEFALATGLCNNLPLTTEFLAMLPEDLDAAIEWAEFPTGPNAASM